MTDIILYNGPSDISTGRKGQRWAREEDEILKKEFNKFLYRISRQLGRSRLSIKYRIKRNHPLLRTRYNNSPTVNATVQIVRESSRSRSYLRFHDSSI